MGHRGRFKRSYRFNRSISSKPKRMRKGIMSSLLLHHMLHGLGAVRTQLKIITCCMTGESEGHDFKPALKASELSCWHWLGVIFQFVWLSWSYFLITPLNSILHSLRGKKSGKAILWQAGKIESPWLLLLIQVWLPPTTQWWQLQDCRTLKHQLRWRW